MEPIEMIVIIVCILIVGGVIVKSIIDRIHGKCGCGDCENCSYNCNKKIYKEKKMDKYLKCESCGAVVKVIVPCNCPNCGITCCGKNMEEFVPKTPLKGTGKILTCASCGAKVEVVVPCNCPNCGFSCCGKNME